MSVWRRVGGSAGVQLAVTGASGLLGILTSRIIVSELGVTAYTQYGLLTALPALLPFADLGIAAVIVNNLASTDDPRHDPAVRRTLTSAFRILAVSGLTIAVVAVALLLLGWWPAVLGAALLPGGDLVVTLCLAVFGLALPLGVGGRVLIGLGRNVTWTAITGLTAPVILAVVVVLASRGSDSGLYAPLASFVAAAVVGLVALTVASRLLGRQVRHAVGAAPRLRTQPGVRVLDVAWPMLAQMIALPIAMQTSRIVLSHRGTIIDLAQYNLAAQLFGMALAAVATAGVALWPVYARARSRSLVESPLRASEVFGLAGAALALAVAAVQPWVAPLATDGQVTLPWMLVAAFCAFVVVQAVKYPSGMYMTDGRGLRFQVLPIAAMVPLNLGLTWALVPPLHAAGPVVATSISVLVCQVVPNALWVRRDLRRRSDDAAAALVAAVGPGSKDAAPASVAESAPAAVQADGLGAAAGSAASPAKRRVEWIDAAKGLAIILVVVLHATEALAGTPSGARSAQTPVWEQANYVLGSMRMPLFFAMSGILAAKWVHAPWRRLMGTKVALFVWLLVLWPFVRAAGYWLGGVAAGDPHAFQGAIDTLDLPEGLAHAVPNPAAQLALTAVLAPFWPFGIRWFIWALAAFFVLARLAHRVPVPVQLAVTGVLSVAGLTGLVTLPNKGWDGAMTYAVFFFGGLYLRAAFLRLGETMTVRRGAVVVGAWVAVMAWFLWAPNHLLLVLLPATGVLAGVVVGRLVAHSGVLRYVGTRTLAVYLTHMLVIHALVVVGGGVLDRMGPGLLTVQILGLSAIAVAVSLGVGRVVARTPLYLLYELPRPLAARLRARVVPDTPQVRPMERV